MKRPRTVLVVSILAAVIATGAAFGQVSGPDGPRRGPGRVGAFGSHAAMPLRALNLTEAQQEQIRMLRQQHREQTKTVATRLRTAMEAQRKAAQATVFDEQAIRATTQALVEAQTEMAVQQARLRHDIHNLLTPDQQAQAAKLQADRETRRAQRRERIQERRPRQ